ncbi:(4Fe-4S)-binding protein [Helcococcus kunzii]|uniref:(4Fe-4S)-binding protein n=1 Tax=Helcococcus kunzii TaxID=40091 RepID=UPI0038A13DD7
MEIDDDVRVYETDELIVYWNAKICQHSGNCVKGAPEVFDVKKRPWINLNNASAEKIMAVIDTCPSGALSYKRKEKIND